MSNLKSNFRLAQGSLLLLKDKLISKVKLVNRFVLSISILFLASCQVFQQSSDPNGESVSATNILVILVDDLGYSDIQPFGGEIPTPNLNTLALEGSRFSNFHTAMKCNPTRAMLMTGMDNNQAASGPRTDYQLRAEIPTIAESLTELGYHTYMAGKWDNGSDSGEWPSQRGFERSMVLLPGAGTHFLPINAVDGEPTSGYLENGQPVELPEDFYSTQHYTDKMIEYIDSNLRDGKPFFAYLAHTAPHYPLQAPAEYIERFSGLYEDGYQATRKARIENLLELGYLDAGSKPWLAEDLPEWVEMSSDDRAVEARRMQIYAAMVSFLDEEIGRLLEYLDTQGLAENTLVIFASDNGADGTARGAGMNDSYDNSIDNLGTASSYITQGINWAKVSSAPYRLVKSFPTEGGTRSPMIVRWPGRVAANSKSDEWFAVRDLAPTFLEIAGVDSDIWQGIELPEQSREVILGRSVLRTLVNSEPTYLESDTRIHTYIENRLGGANVIRENWKLVWWKENGRYLEPMLFDLSVDPMETKDLASEKPEMVAELVSEWRNYSRKFGGALDEANPR